MDIGFKIKDTYLCLNWHILISLVFINVSCISGSTIDVTMIRDATNNSQTKILAVEPNIYTISDPTNPTVVFSKPSGSDLETFECRIDAGDWQSCSSPYSLNIDAVGVHTISVRGKTSLGQTSQVATANVIKGNAPVFLNGKVNDILELGDGSSLWAGEFHATNSNTASHFAKVSFNDEWFYNCMGANHFNGQVNVTHILSDNSMLIGGEFSEFKGTTANSIVKLTENCEIDSTFQTNAGTGFNLTNDTIWDMAKHPTDNGIILVGSFSEYNATDIPDDIVLIEENGTINISTSNFNGNLGVGADANWRSISQIEVIDNDIFIAGNFTEMNTVDTPDSLLKIESNGTVDLSMGSFNNGLGSGFDSTISALAVDNSAVYIGGSFTTLNGSSIATRLAKLNRSDGSLDSTFDTNLGTGLNNIVKAIYVDSSNLYVGGRFSQIDSVTRASGLAKFDLNGNLDLTFNSNLGTGFSNEVKVIKEHPNDSNFLMLGGSFNSLNNSKDKVQSLAMLSKLGVLGNSTSPIPVFSTGTNGYVENIISTSSGLIIQGDFTQIGGQRIPIGLIKLTPSLTLDTDFNSNLGEGANNPVTALEVSPSGDIYVGGTFTRFANQSPQGIVKINSDGTLDLSFAPTSSSDGFDRDIYDIEYFFGSLFVATRSTVYRGTSVPYGVVKIDEAGVLESAMGGFNDNLGAGFDTSSFGTPSIRFIKNDGTNLYLAGIFDLLDSVSTHSALMKIDPTDADINNSFNAAIGSGINDSGFWPGTIYSMFLYNNEIHIAGTFDEVDVTASAKNVNILNTSGTPIFSNTTQPELSVVHSHTVFQNKLIMGGESQVVGESNLLFYNLDGSVDSSLDGKFGAGFVGNKITLVKVVGDYLYIYADSLTVDGQKYNTPLRLDKNFDIDLSFNQKRSN